MTSAPDPTGPFSPRAAPAQAHGAPRAGAVPRMEHVHLTAPDLARRASLEKTRARLAVAAGGFGLLFTVLAVQLARATLVRPERLAEPAVARVEKAAAEPAVTALAERAPLRASILDRNGQPLAISLPAADVFVNPREVTDLNATLRALAGALPGLDTAELAARMTRRSGRAPGVVSGFEYIARHVPPQQAASVMALKLPGVASRPSERRDYPLGRLAAQVLGGVDVDEHGVAGVEKYFDARLKANPVPLLLSLDVRIEAVVRDELSQAMATFKAIGAAGIVMDVNTGELLALVSLPDYDTNDFGHASADARFDRAVTGRYEPGSTFKLQTAAMALDDGVAHIWNEFDASEPIHFGRFTITDFEGKHRWLYLPEVLAYSSNLGAAHIADAVGAVRQRAWLAKMGMFQPVGVELPEAAKPLFPPVRRWSRLTTMTVGFGHGVAVTPLHVVRATAAVATGVVLRPTLLARTPAAGEAPVLQTVADAPSGDPMADMPPEPVLAPPVAPGEAAMAPETSATIRKLMRLVVTAGYGKAAEVAGYYVGGKTGTAEKVAHGAYEKHANVSAFICVFPMNHPRYAVYMMLDDPQGNASTGYFSTAGEVAAPAAGRVIARIAPMLGLYPDLADAPAIEAGLSIPLQPARPAGAPMTVGPAVDTADVAEAVARPRAPSVLPPGVRVRRTAYAGRGAG